MAIKPKQILDTAVGLGHEAVKSGVKLADKLRKDEKAARAPARATSGSPTTVGAPKPGQHGGPKSATTAKPKRKPAAATAKRTPTEPKARAKPKPATKPKPAAKPKAKARAK
jgi:hypothetical protein